MGGLGLTLSIRDFIDAVMQPKGLLIGLVGQMLLLPLLAFSLAILFRPDPVIAIGPILLAACPGEITSNGYVLVSRGDVSLSVTLTTISSLFAVATMPLLAYMAFSTFANNETGLNVPVQNLMLSLGRLTVLPIVCGMVRRWRFPRVADAIREPVRKMAFAIGVILQCYDNETPEDGLVECSNWANAEYDQAVCLHVAVFR